MKFKMWSPFTSWPASLRIYSSDNLEFIQASLVGLTWSGNPKIIGGGNRDSRSLIAFPARQVLLILQTPGCHRGKSSPILGTRLSSVELLLFLNCHVSFRRIFLTMRSWWRNLKYKCIRDRLLTSFPFLHRAPLQIVCRIYFYIKCAGITAQETEKLDLQPIAFGFWSCPSALWDASRPRAVIEWVI